MSEKTILRIGFIGALLATVSWFVYVFAQMSTPALSTVEEPTRFFQTVQEARVVFLLYGWSGVFGILLGLSYLFAFYKVIVAKVPLVQLSLILVIIGSALALFGFFKPLTLVYEFIPMALSVEPEALSFLKTAASTSLEVMELPWNLGSLLLFGIGSGLFAFHAWQAHVGPKWVNGVGMIGGLAGLVWVQAYVPALAIIAPILIATNILAITVWAIGLSASLVRRVPDRYQADINVERPLLSKT